MNSRSRISGICFLLLLSFWAHSQSPADLSLKKARSLEESGQLNEALILYKQLLARDSNNVDYLQHTSHLLSKCGYRCEDKKEREKDYRTALYLAEKSMRLSPKSAEAYYLQALAQGRLIELAGPNAKIDYAKKIRSNCDKSLALNPNLPGSHHILGRWHREMSSFNSVQKFLLESLYGSLPDASYEKAVFHLQKAISLDNNNPLHYLELARIYQQRDESGDEVRAVQVLNQALQLKNIRADNLIFVQQCRDLKAEILD